MTDDTHILRDKVNTAFSGAAFVDTEGPFEGIPGVQWTDPDVENLGLQDSPGFRRASSRAVLVLCPNSGHFAAYDFPEVIEGYRRVATHEQGQSEHPCDCHGRWERKEFLQVWTWDDTGKPYDGCSRCDGTGYIVLGFECALYEPTEEVSS
jgi:hypothetical protein